jgi:hypothetical protein
MPNQPTFDFAADPASGRACTISAARQLIPSWQGQYDSFCSIYAIINGLRLVLAPIAPLSEEECERLFRFGVRLLAERDELVACAQDGLELPSYQIVAHAMANHVGQHSSAMVVVEQLFASDDGVSLVDLVDAVRAAIDRQCVALVSLTGTYDHYTVICGYSPARLRLFDSYGYAWINIAACDVAKPSATARHRIDTSSLLAFSAAPLRPHTPWPKSRRTHDYPGPLPRDRGRRTRCRVRRAHRTLRTADRAHIRIPVCDRGHLRDRQFGHAQQRGPTHL